MAVDQRAVMCYADHREETLIRNVVEPGEAHDVAVEVMLVYDWV
jgi:hypothetical protein